VTLKGVSITPDNLGVRRQTQTNHMPAIAIAEALETISKIMQLVSKTTEGVKDRHTLALLQQIQNRHFKLHTTLVEVQSKFAQMELGHAKAIEERDAEIARLKALVAPRNWQPRGKSPMDL
jgi:hypothetical protein